MLPPWMRSRESLRKQQTKLRSSQMCAYHFFLCAPASKSTCRWFEKITLSRTCTHTQAKKVHLTGMQSCHVSETVITTIKTRASQRARMCVFCLSVCLLFVCLCVGLCELVGILLHLRTYALVHFTSWQERSDGRQTTTVRWCVQFSLSPSPSLSLGQCPSEAFSYWRPLFITPLQGTARC